MKATFCVSQKAEPNQAGISIEPQWQIEAAHSKSSPTREVIFASISARWIIFGWWEERTHPNLEANKSRQDMALFWFGLPSMANTRRWTNCALMLYHRFCLSLNIRALSTQYMCLKRMWLINMINTYPSKHDYSRFYLLLFANHSLSSWLVGM